MWNLFRKQVQESCRTWEERIARAQESGRFTNEDIALAKDWNQCAVGEFRKHVLQVAEIRHADGQNGLADPVMEELGLNFFLYVRTDRVAHAARCFEAMRQQLYARKALATLTKKPKKKRPPTPPVVREAEEILRLAER